MANIFTVQWENRWGDVTRINVFAGDMPAIMAALESGGAEAYHVKVNPMVALNPTTVEKVIYAINNNKDVEDVIEVESRKEIGAIFYFMLLEGRDVGDPFEIVEDPLSYKGPSLVGTKFFHGGVFVFPDSTKVKRLGPGV